MDHQLMEKENLENVDSGSVPKMGMTFGSDKEAYDYYNAYARNVGFSIRKHQVYVRKSDKKLMWREIVCSCEGEREKHSNGTPKKARPQTRFHCKAQLRYELNEASGQYLVTVFVVQHSHELAPPDKAYMLRSHRKIRPAQASMIKSMSAAGIGPSDIYHYCAQEGGGYDKLNFTQSDVDNMVQRKRIEYLKTGDGNLLLEYFRKKKEENSSFFYKIQLAGNQILSCFWCDAKSIIDYECFGDCVSFDTTFKTITYDLPFAPFIGQNHHKQNITFASALVSDETTETFVWIFEQFLEAMGGKVMKTIFTDQAPAISSAIKQVFPDAHHRLCIWHIQQNALRNLSHIYSKYDTFNTHFRRCIYEGEVEEDFLENWSYLLEKYEFRDEDKKWLQRLFDKKEKWAQFYGRQHFCGGMLSTQRSESMNNYFKKYFKRNQLFVEFMKNFDKALSLRRLKEDKADLKSSQTVPNLESQWIVERLAREFYTRKMFTLFQIELKTSVDLGVNNPLESDDVVTYDVEFLVTQRVRRVEYIRSTNTTKCSCQMFEFTGLPCAHMLKVWRINRVESIPSEYFLVRWSKAANPNIVIGTSGNTIEVNSNVPLSERFSELSHMAQTLVINGSMSDELAEVAKKGLKRAIEEVEAYNKSMQDDIGEPADSNTEEYSRLDFLDHISICAPPRKKLKGQSGKRIEGFYDKKKKNGGKKNTGKKVRNDIGNSETCTQPTKIKPRNKGKGDIVEETTLENPSIQNNTSQYQLQRSTDGMGGYGVADDMLENRNYSQVPFSFQQLLADQCVSRNTSDYCQLQENLSSRIMCN